MYMCLHLYIYMVTWRNWGKHGAMCGAERGRTAGFSYNESVASTVEYTVSSQRGPYMDPVDACGGLDHRKDRAPQRPSEGAASMMQYPKTKQDKETIKLMI